MRIIDAAQRSPEWFAARCGLLTASKAKELGFLKDGKTPTAARRDLLMQLVCERLTGQPQEDSFTNAAMQRGADLEPVARRAYEAASGNLVQEVGFCRHDTLAIGCSPDGLVDDDGLLELKCPTSKVHLSYIRAGGLPADYLPQVLHAFLVCDTATYLDFASFDDRFPPELQLFQVRVERQLVGREIEAHYRVVCEFLAEVDREVAAVRGLTVRP